MVHPNHDSLPERHMERHNTTTPILQHNNLRHNSRRQRQQHKNDSRSRNPTPIPRDPRVRRTFATIHIHTSHGSPSLQKNKKGEQLGQTFFSLKSSFKGLAYHYPKLQGFQMIFLDETTFISTINNPAIPKKADGLNIE